MPEIAEAYVTLRAKNKRLKSDLASSKKSISNFATSAKSLLVGIGAGIALHKIIGFGKAAVAAAQEQERAEVELKAALANVGDTSASSMQDMKKFASSIQATTVVGDEAVLSLMKIGVALGGLSGKPLQDATKGAIGLGKQLDMDSKTSMRYYVLALQGEYTMLQRYIPALRTAKTAAEKFALVQKASADGFKLMEAYARTSAGQMEQMKNLWGDMSEEYGKPLVKVLNQTNAELIKMSKNADTKAAFVATAEGIGLAVEAAAKLWTLFVKIQRYNPIALGIGAAGKVYAKSVTDTDEEATTKYAASRAAAGNAVSAEGGGAMAVLKQRMATQAAMRASAPTPHIPAARGGEGSTADMAKSLKTIVENTAPIKNGVPAVMQ